MKVKAKLNYLRIAPRKIRLLADLIRNKKVREAKSLLTFSLKKGAIPLKKLLDSIVASAKNNFQLDEEELLITKITVDEGPKLKRWRARARGRAARIEKKTSHITIVVEGEKRGPVRMLSKEGVGAIKPAPDEKKEEKQKTAKKTSRPENGKAGVAKLKTTKKSWKKIFRRKSF